MKKNRSYFFVLMVLVLSACLAEQTNPLLVSSGGGTCSDGIQNNDEEGVDCGGNCTECDGTEPEVEAPCKSSLSDNIIKIDDSDYTLSSQDYACYNESDYFRIYIIENVYDINVEIYETILPKIPTRYELVPYYDAEPGKASVRLLAFYLYVASEGYLYLSYEDDHWVTEICVTELNGQDRTYELSGRILCDWVE